MDDLFCHPQISRAALWSPACSPLGVFYWDATYRGESHGLWQRRSNHNLFIPTPVYDYSRRHRVCLERNTVALQCRRADQVDPPPPPSLVPTLALAQPPPSRAIRITRLLVCARSFEAPFRGQAPLHAGCRHAAPAVAFPCSARPARAFHLMTSGPSAGTTREPSSRSLRSSAQQFFTRTTQTTTSQRRRKVVEKEEGIRQSDTSTTAGLARGQRVRGSCSQ